MLRTVSIIVALLMSAATVQPALAGGPNEVVVVSAHVKVSDLELSSHRDAARAIERMAHVASHLCAPEGGTALRLSKPAWQLKCEAAALDKAVAQAGVPMLSLALSERLGGDNVQVAGR